MFSALPEGARPGAVPRSRVLILLLAVLAAAVALVVPTAGKADAIARATQTMYTPPPNSPAQGSLYPRAIRLEHNGASNGTLLATFEQYTSGTPVFPIYRSTDNGNSWTQISSIADTHNGYGLRYQPQLFELPTQIGNFPAGTIFCAGNSLPADLSSTELDLYASTDRGATWSFVSEIAKGGKGVPNNGETPVWEPFLLVSGNKLIVYYSDQRDPAHGQKMVHQTTTDGINWGPVVDDVAYPRYTDRPGMPVVAKLPNGNYVMTYEYGGAPEKNFAVYYKISSDPEGFGSAPGQVLRATDGYVPSSSPYITWLPTGGPNGTLAVSAYSSTDLFLNTQNGAANAWTRIASTVPGGYTRAMVPLADGHSLEVFSGGYLNTTQNPVTYGTIDLTGGISDGATYTMSNAHSGLKLAIAGGSPTNGTFATQQNADNATDQQWRFDLQPSGYFKIFNVATGKVLGVKDQWPGDGAKILQWDDNGTLDHEWAVAPDPAGGFTAVNRLTGKYLEIPNASTTVGQAADQWGSTGCDCQRWNLTQVALPPLGTGQYVLVNKNSGKFLEMPGATTAVGAQAGQWVNTACNCQMWTFQSAGSGAWKMKNVRSNLFLDVNGSSNAAGAAVIQNTSSGATSQQWTLTDAGGGYYKLVNTNSGLVADVASASTANGALIVQSTGTANDSQLWKIVRIN
ncbi:RICIN domain-containing protein [Streptomyces sp. S.PNR 29]|uniref:RICIN domain-containing protein n=1 Tax=Streptomyces sp. S.PNR 29 TaxID=2973805 RepID=UPI0025B1F5BA|nr:RICIN domain-containing protein [Streptomyces sp. S.PNR 29]MDN0198183.1 RICIN domain-containing protein [Streptomyces sp. S.PNR 29]